MKEPFLGLALIVFAYTITESAASAGCGSRIDGNDDPNCKVATSLGTAATTKDIARPAAQWSVGGSSRFQKVDQQDDSLEDAKKTIDNVANAMAGAMADVASRLVEPNARQMELEAQIIMESGCHLGSMSMAVVSLAVGTAAIFMPPLAAVAGGVAGTVIGAQAIAFDAAENAGQCE